MNLIHIIFELHRLEIDTLVNFNLLTLMWLMMILRKLAIVTCWRAHKLFRALVSNVYSALNLAYILSGVDLRKFVRKFMIVKYLHLACFCCYTSVALILLLLILGFLSSNPLSYSFSYVGIIIINDLWVALQIILAFKAVCWLLTSDILILYSRSCRARMH